MPAPSRPEPVAGDVQADQHRDPGEAEHQAGRCGPVVSGSVRSISRAMATGSIAISRPVSDDVMCTSPYVISRNGPMMCTAASTATIPSRPRRAPSVPRAAAAGSSTSAAIAARPATTNIGDRSSMAILMRKYGIPHSTETRRKSNQARRFTRSSLAGYRSKR